MESDKRRPLTPATSEESRITTISEPTMLVLTGNNLNKRHQELNAKVNEAAALNVSFDEVKKKSEHSDVDKLFKINLASKYKKTDYIVDVLKSGDSLYISHALKCVWLYDDEHSNIINPDYLHQDIFPFMSMRMKKKMLSIICMHVRNEERARDFFNYCMSAKLYKSAVSFLPFIPELLKLEIIHDDRLYRKLYDVIHYNDDKVWQNVIGNSFTLAEARIIKIPDFNTLLAVRHLYFINDSRYLDLLETYVKIDPNYRYYRTNKMGSRMSKDIVKKYKDRIFNHPKTYVNVLKTNIMTKHFSKNEAKVLLGRLLPDEVDSFWSLDYCKYYKDLINIIPFEERFEFVRIIFGEKYANATFDNYDEFYKLHYFEMMSVEEREKWALRYIEAQDDIKVNSNYRWYRFITFEKAFKDIKKCVMTVLDRDLRSNIVNVLIKCAKNQRELETLLKHYYDRHINEKRYNKEKFIDQVLAEHNLLTVDECCWTAFNKLLYSIELYVPGSICKRAYKVIATLYHIIHNKEIPVELHDFLDNVTIPQLLQYDTPQLSADIRDIIYKNLFQYYLNKVKKFEDQTYNDVVKEKVSEPIRKLLDLIEFYKKPKAEVPELVMKFAELNWDKYCYYTLFKTESKVQVLKKGDLTRLLKKDVSLLIDELPNVKQRFNDYDFDLNSLFKKLRVYFSNDITKDHLHFLLQIVDDQNNDSTCVYKAVYGVFQIADENFKTEFMGKYIPETPKIDHSQINRHFLNIQEAICRSACFSRPPIPLSIYLKYMKGDYVHYCLPVFNTYFANLTPPRFLEFVHSIIDTPISVQKHSVRLAFKCFTTEKLTEFILNTWQKTKNVTFRKVIYELLFNKVVSSDGKDEVELFEVLKKVILDLNEDDDDSLFINGQEYKMKEHLRGEYIETFWQLICKLPDKPKNLNRMSDVINCMINNILLLSEDIIRVVVNEHLQFMLVEKQIRPHYEKPELNTLNETKWRLVETYILSIRDEKDEATKLELIKFIMNKCFEMWHDVHNDIYTLQQYCSRFVNNIQSNCASHCYINKDYSFRNTVLDYLIKALLDTRPSYEVYLFVWDLRLTLLARKAMRAIEVKFQDCSVTYEELKGIISVYSNELVNLLKENLYLSLFSEIVKKIRVNISHINTLLNSYNVNNYEDLNVIIANELIRFDTKEAYLVALEIFPVDYENRHGSIICEDDYSRVKSKFNTFEDNEIKCINFQKFGCDFKRRKFF